MEVRKLIINEEVITKWPSLKLGALVVNNPKGLSALHISLETLANDVAEYVKVRFSNVESIERHPFIRLWNYVYSSFGSSSRPISPPALELCRKIIEGGGLCVEESLLTFRDVFQCVQLMPLTTFDLAKVKGDIRLIMAKDGKLAGGFSADLGEILENEIVYSDDEGVLTRYWNYEISSRVRPVPTSQTCICLLEAPEFIISNEVFDNALAELAASLREEFGGRVQLVRCLGKDREVVIPLSTFSEGS